MQILNEQEAVRLYGKGKKTMNAAEGWLFDNEDGQVRIKTLIGMQENQTCVVSIKDFMEYGSKSKKGYTHHVNLNRVFILDEIPLKATGRNENILIKKGERFDATIYDKDDKVSMLPAHQQLIREKINEILHKAPSWGPED